MPIMPFDSIEEEYATMTLVRLQNVMLEMDNPERERTSGEGLLCGANALYQAIRPFAPNISKTAIIKLIRSLNGGDEFFVTDQLKTAATHLGCNLLITAPTGLACDWDDDATAEHANAQVNPAASFIRIAIHNDGGAHYENYVWNSMHIYA